MYQVIIVFHVLLGLGIIGLVLMQQGKGADAGAAFGAGASGSVFGAQGAASFLSRTTAILATLFFLTSLGLAIMNSQKGVAYDLMSEPAGKQDTLALPDVEGANPEAQVPAPVPSVGTESAPAVPAVTPAPVSETPAVIETVVPKAEELKKVEIKSKASSDTGKKTEKK